MKLFLLSTVFLVASVSAIGNPYGGGGGPPKCTCPFNYKLVNREYGRAWCMKFFPGNESFFEAEKICRCQGGATLSGIETPSELKKMSRDINSYFEDNGIQSGGIWVGAYRRKDCRVPDLQKKPECTKEEQYQWTDRHTMGKAMWEKYWTEGAPHNNNVGAHREFCVHLQASIDPAVEAKNLTERFDNRVCVHQEGETQFPTAGFICGRPAKCTGGNNDGAGGYGQMVMIGAARPTKKT